MCRPLGLLSSYCHQLVAAPPYRPSWLPLARQISRALLGDDERLKLRWDEARDGEVGAAPGAWPAADGTSTLACPASSAPYLPSFLVLLTNCAPALCFPALSALQR